MKIGFSTLALFMKSFEDFLDTATADGFDLVEILCEGPYWPRNILSQAEGLDVFASYDVDVFLHAPTIDLNPASMNQGIRDETLRQIKETLDLASKIGAEAITTHPGVIHRLEDRIREMGKHFAIETLKKANQYAEDLGVILSVENMPHRYAYFCNTAQEHSYFLDQCGCHATVDLGHANTTNHPGSFLKLEKIYYYHLSDNNGEKDQHVALGEGTLDLSLINGIERGIIELNNYDDVLKSRNLLLNLSK
ncbi:MULTISPECIES: sugar phosphate isomerase/epimerase family protein [Methanobacterium]|jgi:sugar phosphate isomerase/epimerase|uniref:Sugar phosphate isomerase/epimerase n=2 Tax=Methanobacteriaceae TaxID=2159 RepID=A0A2H4VSA2_9EURY|nr:MULTISPECIES: sugar phosphate isomerase/epimerase [Methanobacterium]MBW4256400.1 sugar phosphate isomerase/epimerase [Methanobacterium sp. YSL]PKL73994.1 MAG: sugar phosphate isomerase/epimerase [Methanobacteriales archaeon HGW-Methanobacteriales-2]AUB55193.1 xylose isomerase [Methanobacterium subterraneum]AUB57820.1 xylose isomerase [Methanobacterium sp. MZ-A1]AUB60946.1 xylose isomerase [Methanobacterium subterraneum]